MRFFFVARSICEWTQQDWQTLIWDVAHIDQLILAPPDRTAGPLKHTDNVTHCCAGQSSIAVSPLQHRDHFALGVRIRKVDDVSGVSGEEGCRHATIMALHELVLVFAGIETGANSDMSTMGS